MAEERAEEVEEGDDPVGVLQRHRRTPGDHLEQGNHGPEENQDQRLTIAHGPEENQRLTITHGPEENQDQRLTINHGASRTRTRG